MMSSNWEKILLGPQETIRQALKIIDEQASRIVLIVDDASRLLGTVTDGDIRRGLLNNISMDASVDSIMNKNPITSEPGISVKIHKKIMTDHRILSLPLVEAGIVKGLRDLYDSRDVISHDNPVFLMAGGFGTRLRPLTDNCPKPLLKVGNKPILEITLTEFVSYGFKNFYISTHYMPEKIMEHFGDGSKWGINIHYVYEESPLGTGGALGLLPDDINRLPLIMMNGDVLTNIDFDKLLDFHNNSNADATMCVREYEYQIPYGVIYGEKSKIIRMEEKPVQRFHVNAGIYVLNSSIVTSVKKNSRIDMPTLLENKIAEEGSVMMFPIHEYWLDIGRMDDYNRAQNDICNLELNFHE
ncbi:nucleotidyltransferase family protein [Erwinia sp. P6884]|uniref:nucleotidyltransferase family protein n=1 Tax=Erwinia sp. P6884 TaxID=3141450 RepID=UPI00319B303E